MGAPASEQTEVYIAYDSDYIYFGFYAHYSDPSIMRANRVDRDRAFADDLFTVYLDTYIDQQWASTSTSTATACRETASCERGRGGRRRYGHVPTEPLNTLFSTGAQIVEDGYTAEMAIPFKSLRYPMPRRTAPIAGASRSSGRSRARSEENHGVGTHVTGESSFFSQMGLLEGMTDLSKSRNLEILPTVTAIQYGVDRSDAAGVRQSAARSRCRRES